MTQQNQRPIITDYPSENTDDRTVKTWNYRIVKEIYPDGTVLFGIHEVYYDQNGEVVNMTLDAIPLVCETLEGLLEQLEWMSACTNKETLTLMKSDTEENKDDT